MAGSSPRRTRAEFSDQDRDYMIKYLAKYTADPQGRSGNEIWKALVENKKHKWSWAHRHTWQSWRNHYVKDKDWFDYKIRKYQKKNPSLKPLPSPRNGTSSTPKKGDEKRKRVSYTDEDDAHLADYLAEHSLGTAGRLGMKLYQILVANVDKRPWASRHTYQSWRERYSKHRERFDKYIEEYQRDHPTGAIFETPAGARRQKEARSEEDEAIPEENQEQEDAEAGEKQGAADEDNEVEDALHEPDGVDEHGVTGRADGPSRGNDAEEQARGKRRRSNGTSDDAGGSRKSKRRLIDGYASAEEPARAAVEENGGEHGERAGEADASAAGDELQVKPHMAKRDRGAKEKLVGPPLPSDDYSGNIFDASEPSDSETEAEEDGEEEEEEEENPPMIVEREEEEEEEEEDQLASSIDGSAQRQGMDVDVDRRASSRREPSESVSPEGTPSPTTVGHAQISQAQLYPTLPSPPQPIVEADDLHLPGQFPATSTAVSARGASVLSEAIPLAHELLAKSKEEMKPLISLISQNPTPPASSPPADVKPKVERSHSPTPLRRSVASDAVADPVQPGPSAVVDTTPRAHLPQSEANNKFIRKPSEDIFASVATTPVLSSSRDVTPTVTQAQERRLKRPREPPRLQEGPYNHVFTDAMGRTRVSGARATGVAAEDDSDREDGDAETDWPPLRGRDKGKGKEQPRPTLATSVTKVKAEPQDSTAAMRQLRGLQPGTHHPFSQPTQDPEASQYSQAQYSQSQHHPFSQPSQRFADAEAGWLRSSRLQAESVPYFKLPKAHLDRLERELNKHGHLLQGGMRNEDQRASIITSTPVRRHLTGPRADDPIPGPSDVGHTVPQSPSRSPELGRSVRFDMTLSDIKGKRRDYGPSTPHVSRRRHTFEGSSAFQAQFRADRPSGDHIRVRQSLPLLPSAPHGIRSADDSFVGTTSNSFSFRRPHKRESLSFVQQPKHRSASAEPEPPIQISEDDESVVVHIGVETAIQTMSENHGFNPEIVRRVWSQTQSLRMTDTMLRQMREAAEKAALQFVENLEGAHEGGFTFDIRPNARVRSPARNEAPRRSSHNRDNSILRITPVGADTEENLQYSPPRPTRAGQYVRLVKEGRQSEAIAREVSHAAGISISQTPQKDESHADYEATGDSSDRHDTLGNDRNFEGETADDSQRPSVISRRNTAGDAAKIALGKKLGRMLANVNA